jgi:L-threonylcarbamoyladenylate synthase
MGIIGTDIDKAAALLQQGEVVGIPTETVYGLAGNALHEAAIINIFKTKNRPFFEPLICHFRDIDSIRPYVLSFPEKALQLAKEFMPGPLTLLLPKSDLIPDLITNGSSFVAVRVPQHPMAQALLAKLDFPLAAPSANPFGYISPTTAQHVADQLGDKIAYILDGGDCSLGIESTIVMFDNEEPVILRLGALKIELIEACIGKVITKSYVGSNPQAPGQLDKHYSPHTKIVLTNDADETIKSLGTDQKIGALLFSTASDVLAIEHQLILSRTADIDEAARHLFSFLRQLDAMDCAVIVAELLPEKGLGPAINDRLRRAAAK